MSFRKTPEGSATTAASALSRRDFLRIVGATTLAAGAVNVVAACGDDDDDVGEKTGTGDSTTGDSATGGTTDNSTDGSTDGTSDGSADGSTTGGDATDPASTDDTDDTGLAYATGGTGAIKAEGYGNPFAAGLGSTCAVFKASTLGPCYTQPENRLDISEGQSGLPMRLEFLVVDASCKPVPNASVDIWHCDINGVYSGSDVQAMCTGNNAAALKSEWFRGVQTAGADGRVSFNTCYPGWYPGRTTHIHFTVRVDGKEYVTSQVFFDDAFNSKTLTSHPEYKARGDKNTANARDSIYRSAGGVGAQLETALQEGGVLLAWKAITVNG
jgi:protocatechuate 3,4-dioxygenase beta subunit